jgi:hypothetical protein
MNGKEKGRQLVSHFLRWSGVFRSSRSLRNVQLRYAGILLEGFKDFDTFSFGKASYILEGVKPEIICQKAWIVCPQLIAKLANSHRNQSVVPAIITIIIVATDRIGTISHLRTWQSFLRCTLPQRCT